MWEHLQINQIRRCISTPVILGRYGWGILCPNNLKPRSGSPSLRFRLLGIIHCRLNCGDRSRPPGALLLIQTRIDPTSALAKFVVSLQYEWEHSLEMDILTTGLFQGGSQI